jgi:hypothetical protein
VQALSAPQRIVVLSSAELPGPVVAGGAEERHRGGVRRLVLHAVRHLAEGARHARPEAARLRRGASRCGMLPAQLPAGRAGIRAASDYSRNVAGLFQM